MLYQIKSETLLIKIDRAMILDISTGDEISVEGLGGGKYRWKDQDSQFIESNPDAEIFLRIERSGEGVYTPESIEVWQPSPEV